MKRFSRKFKKATAIVLGTLTVSTSAVSIGAPEAQANVGFWFGALLNQPENLGWAAQVLRNNWGKTVRYANVSPQQAYNLYYQAGGNADAIRKHCTNVALDRQIILNNRWDRSYAYWTNGYGLIIAVAEPNGTVQCHKIERR